MRGNKVDHRAARAGFKPAGVEKARIIWPSVTLARHLSHSSAPRLTAFPLARTTQLELGFVSPGLWLVAIANSEQSSCEDRADSCSRPSRERRRGAGHASFGAGEGVVCGADASSTRDGAGQPPRPHRCGAKLRLAKAWWCNA